MQWVSEKEPPELAWFFCGQEKGESLESGPPLPDMDHLERNTFSLIDFVDWLATCEACLPFGVLLLCILVYSVCTLSLAFNEITLPIKKKKVVVNL